MCAKYELLKKYILKYPVHNPPGSAREEELNYRINDLRHFYEHFEHIDTAINSFENFVAIRQEVSNILQKTIKNMESKGNREFALELKPYQDKSTLDILEKIKKDTKLQQNVTPLLNNLVKKDAEFRKSNFFEKAVDDVKGAFNKVSNWGKNVFG